MAASWTKKNSPYCKVSFEAQRLGSFLLQSLYENHLFFSKLYTNFLLQIYENGLLPTAHDQFGRYSSKWILQEDNDPKHMSNVAKRSDNSVHRLEWLSMSPEFNHIENIWQVMKINLSKQ